MDSSSEDKKIEYKPQEIEPKWPIRHPAKGGTPQGKQEYNPSVIEQHWQAVWEKEKTFSPDLADAKKPYYNLMMFPYPSAEGLHVGNMYAFTGADVHGRFKRMQGWDVFEPIGLDGFGIHSENYALKVNKHPAEQAKISEKNFYRQLRATGNGFDFSRTLETYDPLYYRWTQWLFIQMFKQGLAYRKKAQVNWCPSDKTVLADEQVIDGRCERDGAIVEKRDLEQWFFKITDYADRLLYGLDQIDWPEKIKTAQRQWIGKKTGINITYKIEGSSETVKVFTTRPDTNFGATFIALAPEHPLSLKLANPQCKKDVERYINVSKKKTDTERQEEGREKTGVFTGSHAINDLTGYKMPIWVSDFVLMEFGTGAVVGVPGHDKRDFEFATKFGLEIVRVVVGKDGDSSKIEKIEQVQEEEGKMVNSGFLDGLDIHQATEKIMDHMEKKGYGEREVTYHLRDWLISRQRYWGPPIPMVFCPDCFKNKRGERDDMPGWWTVPEEDLPVILPDVKDWRPRSSPESSGSSPRESSGRAGQAEGPLANHPEFYEIKCPSCSSKAKRETDVSDTFLDSAWYYLRYLSLGDSENPKTQSKDVKPTQNLKFQISNLKLPYEPELVKRWCPVAIYIGGAEHSVLHLMYVRFVAMVLHNLKNYAQRDPSLRSGQIASDLALPFSEPFPKFFAHGLIVKDGAKMSKSRGNVVIPDEYIKKYGADALRMYLMFLGQFRDGGDFRDTGIEGMHRFVRRVWTLLTKYQISNIKYQISDERLRFMHKTIKGVTEDIEEFSYNTAIAKMMEWYNFLAEELKTQNSKLKIEEAEVFLKLLAPFAPHATEELWQKIHADSERINTDQRKSVHNQWKSIHVAEWPTWDERYLVQDILTIGIQVNGKRRGEIEVGSEKLEVRSWIEEKAREEVQKYLEGKEVRKVIYVPGKIINFVV